MSYEVEVKYRAVDHQALAGMLKQKGAETGGVVDQEDHYFNHPARDFAASGEAFRIRRNGEENRLTYKGRKQGGPTKTRQEIEIAFSEGSATFQQMVALFQVLGFRPVAAVRKRRESFHLRYQNLDMEVTLDEAEGLGQFVEIETIVPGSEDLSAAQSAVLALAGDLALKEVEPRSYLRMVLDYRDK